MTRNSLAATSLVAAIPAGFMAYFGVMAFLNYVENMPMMLKVVNGMALLVSALMVLSPVGIMLFVKGKSADSTDEAGALDATGATAAVIDAPGIEDDVDEAEFGAADEVEEFDTADEAVDAEEDIESADDDFEAADDDFEAADDFGDEDFDDAIASGDDDAFEFDDDEFEFDDDEFK